MYVFLESKIRGRMILTGWNTKLREQRLRKTEGLERWFLVYLHNH